MPVLDSILASKQSEVEKLKTDRELAEMLARIPAIKGGQPLPEGRFRAALNRGSQSLRIIAECKKASPSMGLIRPDYDIGPIAVEYEKCGAAALSVLTDEPFFQGNTGHLELAASTVAIPVLRKDFIISELQIAEAKRHGASAVLLIVRILDDKAIVRFSGLAAKLGLDCLVEVHNENEVKRAIDCGCKIIGVNHRDLDTLQMDLTLSRRMEDQIRSAGALLVAESGIENSDALKEVSGYADAALIGTYFMKSGNIAEAWSNLFSFGA